MRKYLSIIIAVIIFAALSVVEATAQIPEAPALNAEEVALVIRDSDNAHQVAKAALDAIGCMLTALSEEVEWTAEDCAKRLRVDLEGLSQEHRLLHPRIVQMLTAKLEERQS